MYLTIYGNTDWLEFKKIFRKGNSIFHNYIKKYVIEPINPKTPSVCQSLTLGKKEEKREVLLFNEENMCLSYLLNIISVWLEKRQEFRVDCSNDASGWENSSGSSCKEPNAGRWLANAERI